MSNKAIKKLAKRCTQLSTLYFGQCRWLSEKALRYLAKHCSQSLKALELAECRSMITRESVDFMTVCAKNVTYLDFTDTGVENHVLEILTENVRSFCLIFL